MTASLDMIRGRSNVVTMTNNSGGALIAGDVCIQDATADENVTTTTSAASTSKVFVAAESIGIGAAGKFYESGYCPYVKPNASLTRGHFLFTDTVAKQATGSASYAAGAFGRVLKAGTTPSAIIYSQTAQISGGGVTRSGATTDNHLAVWNGSNADSIKDGGVPGSGGATTFTTAQASPPTAAAAGDIWLPNNGVHVARATAADSSHWVPWGPTWPMADPNLQTFAWANQGTATISSVNGGILLDTPANMGAGIRAQVKAKSAPYTITAYLQFNTAHVYATADCAMGLCFSDGTLFQICGVYLNGGGAAVQTWVAKFSDASTYNSSYIQTTIGTAPPISVIPALPHWWRIADNNTNRIFSFSMDGYKWFVIHTIGRTDYLTATQVGFFVNNLGTGYDAALRVLSWVEA